MRFLPPILVLTLSVAGFAQGQTFRWTDANGDIHYGDSPPLDQSELQIDRLPLETEGSHSNGNDGRVRATERQLLWQLRSENNLDEKKMRSEYTRKAHVRCDELKNEVQEALRQYNFAAEAEEEWRHAHYQAKNQAMEDYCGQIDMAVRRQMCRYFMLYPAAELGARAAVERGRKKYCDGD